MLSVASCTRFCLQDLLIYSLKGLGGWAHLATQNGVEVPQEIQSFITGATFSTLTNGVQQPKKSNFITHV
jgi:hydroxylamine reductase (hybrid-cluster protein)